MGIASISRGDPRADFLKPYCREVAELTGNSRWEETADAVEAAMFEAKGLRPNLDWPTARLYYYLGLPVELYTPLFVASRAVGWCAHVIEQYEQNRLIRPRAHYIGPERASLAGAATGRRRPRRLAGGLRKVDLRPAERSVQQKATEPPQRLRRVDQQLLAASAFAGQVLGRDRKDVGGQVEAAHFGEHVDPRRRIADQRPQSFAFRGESRCKASAQSSVGRPASTSPPADILLAASSLQSFKSFRI